MHTCHMHLDCGEPAFPIAVALSRQLMNSIPHSVPTPSCKQPIQCRVLFQCIYTRRFLNFYSPTSSHWAPRATSRKFCGRRKLRQTSSSRSHSVLFFDKMTKAPLSGPAPPPATASSALQPCHLLLTFFHVYYSSSSTRPYLCSVDADVCSAM